VAKPAILHKGDAIGIVCSARKVNLFEIKDAINLFNSWQLQVILGKTIHLEDNQFAGSDEQRREDIQFFLFNKQVKAIFIARGGYGSIRILDKLNFASFNKTPKWIIGYSDITAILNHIFFTQGACSLLATMPINIKEENFSSSSIETLHNCLFNEKEMERIYPNSPLNIKGRAKGEAIGGNLSVLYSLLGSISFGDTKGKILFIEDLDEYLYHIDRMMQSLKRAGKLKSLSGLVVGAFTKMHDNDIPFGKTAQEIILDAVKEYNYPVCFDIPFGHIEERNEAFIIGKTTSLIVGEENVVIVQ
jgi:muramoyltetrapeptide carboxypeptidase